MGRGKSKRKALQKKKRLAKMKQGKLVPFDLQNSPIKYTGIKNRYCYKTNIHKLIYKEGQFFNVKYQASNITMCNFKNARFENVDFVGCNLKASNFSDAVLKNVIFTNCNLKCVTFEGCHFENVYFITTNTRFCEAMPSSGYTILTRYPQINIEGIDQLQEALGGFNLIDDVYKYHVLHVTHKRVNLWNISILLDMYGNNIGRALLAFSKRDKLRHLYTLGSYMNFIACYLKK
ncbi:Pentapeptide repeat-containing protein [Anaerovibrio lipolyticus DSM 3074]|uniref:Pentapeptide repeat-containing protein n=2 Tax=Anaerovibrio lipolyticus TaxID=82374 RepID=A0A0B2JF87_9FIRM|nr:pentapeptide repeat-containing protein [Anaerovibrio lipolyticus]KHM45448.1 hypothetical protein NZ47_13910 [Anaerovibrio lipolyticus]SHJ11475.1 Pentapeptide repeat-containing protein [Anaerovibrio lipolyticus DSM 3074]